MSARTFAGAVFAVFCAAMLGLAAGAVWMMAAVSLRQTSPWLALPAGWLLAVAMRRWICPDSRAGAVVLAAASSLLAAAYFNLLLAAMRVAQNMGIGLVDALRTAGLSMLLALARLGLAPRDVAWALAGAACAALVASRRSRRVARG